MQPPKVGGEQQLAPFPREPSEAWPAGTPSNHSSYLHFSPAVCMFERSRLSVIHVPKAPHYTVKLHKTAEAWKDIVFIYFYFFALCQCSQSGAIAENVPFIVSS